MTALRVHRENLFDPETVKRGGRIVKLMGDGTLVEFPSVVDAVKCALAIQQALAEENGPIKLRIGINLGDIIIDGDDIYGDGVNIAARLETLAEPGGICISSIVHESLGNRVETEFTDAGEHEVKNIIRPIRVFQWPTGMAKPERLLHSDTRRSGRPGIVVLPFSNMSSNSGQDGFAIGLTEDLTTALSRDRAYNVKARSSIFSDKEPASDLFEIAKALDADYLLEGSVRCIGRNIRITVQLIEARTGNHVWAERFDRELNDGFTVQDEISQRVSSIIFERIWQDIARNISQKPEHEYTAYDYVYLAIERLHRFEPDEAMVAAKLLSQAQALDADIPIFHMAAGFNYLMDGLYLGNTFGDSLEKAHQHAGRLWELAPDNAQTYRLLSRVYWTRGHQEEAWECVERALKINSNDGDIIANRGVYHLHNGQPEVARQWIDKVLEMHDETPHTAEIMHFWKALSWLVDKDYRAALAELARISGLHFPKNLIRSSCLALLGQMDQARSSVDDLLNVRAGLRLRDLGYWQNFARESDRQHLHDALARAGLPE